MITVPAAAARFAAGYPGPSASPSGSATGPYWYEQYEVNPDLISVIDIGAGTQASFTVPLKKDESTRGMRTDGTWLAMIVAVGAVDCPTTVHWRLLVTRLGPDGLPDTGAGGFAEVAHGSTAGQKIPGQECAVVVLPAFDLEAGRLAWIEDVGASGSAVHVMDLSGAPRDDEYRFKRHAYGLALSREAVAWIEYSDLMALLPQTGMQPSEGAELPDWHVMEAELGDPMAHPVDLGGSGDASAPRGQPAILLDGSAVVAMTYLEATNTTTIVRSNPAAAPTVIDDGHQGRVCRASDAVGGVLLLVCEWPNLNVSSDGSESPLSMGAVWTAAKGLRAVTVGADGPTQAWTLLHLSGWAVLFGSQGYTAIPMSALTAP